MDAREALARTIFPQAFKSRIDMRPLAFTAADRVLAAGYVPASEVQRAREEALREAARLVEGVSTWFTTDDHARDCAADIRALATAPAAPGGQDGE